MGHKADPYYEVQLSFPLFLLQCYKSKLQKKCQAKTFVESVAWIEAALLDGE
jgi:hypothetical protein